MNWNGGGNAQLTNQGDSVQKFGENLVRVQKDLKLWHRKRFGKMQKELEACKQTILFFDKIEETRDLIAKEFVSRQKMCERAYELATNIELRWQQWARCNWLASGDCNTRFFHSYASARTRKNTVTMLEIEGVEL